MAEYKGKLLKGIFESAKNVILSNGENVEEKTPKSISLDMVTSDANGFISLGLPNTCEVIAVSVIGYSIFAWKRSTGFWFGTVVNGSITPVANSTFSDVTVTYVD